MRKIRKKKENQLSNEHSDDMTKEKIHTCGDAPSKLNNSHSLNVVYRKTIAIAIPL